MSSTHTLLKTGSRYKRALLLTASLTPMFVMALPQQGDFTSVNGGTTYNTTANAGTVDVTQNNRIVEFGGAGINLSASETLNFNASNSNWSLLVRDTSNAVSNIDGTLNGNLRVFLVNRNGLLFGENAQINLNSFVASTLDINNTAFENTNNANPNDDSFSFTTSNGPASIRIEGLSVQSGADVAFIANQIDVDGNVEAPNGTVSLATANSITVSYNDNALMQFDITEGVQSAVPGKRNAIDISSASNVEAGNVNLLAYANDAYSFAINNQGVIKATGINNEGGVISLVGSGGRTTNTGTLEVEDGDNSAGRISIATDFLLLRGAFVGSENAIADLLMGGESSSSQLVIDSNRFELNIGSMNINGLSAADSMRGPSNYSVTGDNSGSAFFNGEEKITWQNYEELVGDSSDEVFNISSNGVFDGVLRGAGGDDTFNIEGAVNELYGEDGDDTFNLLDVGSAQFIDGGNHLVGELEGGDVIQNLFEVESGSTPELGNAANVREWVNVEAISEIFPVVLPSPPTDPFTPNDPIVDISIPTDVGLGLTGDNNLRLPCAYISRDDDLDETQAWLECDKEVDPFEALLSSIIYFDFDQSTLTAQSIERLNDVANYVVGSNAIQKIVLSGHTDSWGSNAYNDRLAEKRVIVAANFLQSKGVSSDLISQYSYGETLPAEPNDSELNRALNRRVTITLEK